MLLSYPRTTAFVRWVASLTEQRRECIWTAGAQWDIWFEINRRFGLGPLPAIDRHCQPNLPTRKGTEQRGHWLCLCGQTLLVLVLLFLHEERCHFREAQVSWRNQTVASTSIWPPRVKPSPSCLTLGQATQTLTQVGFGLILPGGGGWFPRPGRSFWDSLSP